MGHVNGQKLTHTFLACSGSFPPCFQGRWGQALWGVHTKRTGELHTMCGKKFPLKLILQKNCALTSPANLPSLPAAAAMLFLCWFSASSLQEGGTHLINDLVYLNLLWKKALRQRHIRLCHAAAFQHLQHLCSHGFQERWKAHSAAFSIYQLFTDQR